MGTLLAQVMTPSGGNVTPWTRVFGSHLDALRILRQMTGVGETLPSPNPANEKTAKSICEDKKIEKVIDLDPDWALRILLHCIEGADLKFNS